MPAEMLLRASVIRTGRRSIVCPTHSAVAGMSCMTPTAPAWLTTPCCHPDSCQATANASLRGTPWRSASRTMMRRIDSRSATTAAILDDIFACGAWPEAGGLAPGITSRWPTKMRLGLARWFAAAIELTLTP